MTISAAKWWGSSATFKRCTAEKVSFIVLAEADFFLTVFAVFLGFYEMNPVVRFLFQVPALMIVVKGLLPVVIAWAIPGRLLWPSIGALGLVLIWNLKELLVAIL